MCIGEYTVQTEDVRTHISCSAYTAPTLACIAEGVSELNKIFVGGFRIVNVLVTSTV